MIEVDGMSHFFAFVQAGRKKKGKVKWAEFVIVCFFFRQLMLIFSIVIIVLCALSFFSASSSSSLALSFLLVCPTRSLSSVDHC